MAKTWYKSSRTGAITTDSRGFQFVKTLSYRSLSGLYWNDYYGMYSSAAGGWTQAVQNGYSDTPEYHTSGDIYSRTQASGSTITPGYVVGHIYSVTAYTISTSQTTGGSVSGGGDYESGSSISIKASPNGGYVVASIGDTSFTPSLGYKSITKKVTADEDVPVVFAPYYKIAFDETEDVISPCVEGEVYKIPSTIPEKEGYGFAGWSRAEGSATAEYQPGDDIFIDSFAPGETITLYAVWTQGTLTYDPNGGSPTPDPVIYHGTVVLADAIGREGRVFVGWKIGDQTYEAGANYKLERSVTAVAQWSTISFKNSNPEAGKISLYDLTANKKVADENSDGYLIYNGTAGSRYRVDCELSGVLYTKQGVYVDGEYEEPYTFVFDGTDVTGEYFYEETPLYSILLECTPEGNSAAVTTPAEPDKDGKYAKGRFVEVAGTPAPGYKLKSANILRADTGQSVGSVDNIENNIFTVTDSLAYDIRIKLMFVKENYSVTVSVDEPSRNAITEVTAKIGESAVVSATYGDEVVFSASVAEGYIFSGWYENGSLVSSEAEYSHSVTGSIALVAKAKVAVTMTVEYGDAGDQTCSVTVNGGAVEMPFYVILGDSFSYALVLGAWGDGADDTWKFDAWYENDEATPYGASGAIAPTRAMSLAAKVTQKVIVRTVTVLFRNEETLTEIEVDASAVTTSPEPASKELVDKEIVLTFTGTQEVEFLFVDEIITGAESLAFSKVTAGAGEYPDPMFKILVNNDLEMIADYGSLGERTTSVSYADGCDRTMGEIRIDNLSSTTDPVPMSVIKNRGESVELRAVVNNGYRFIGWYLRPEGIGDAYIASADTDLNVTTNRTLYAKFAKDPNAIYKWEGSGENKMMTWRSKTYEASRPFNPSACRVDTTGYPVWAMSVEMFSAPDAAPTAVAELNNVASQDSRRLPIRRMERYMQIAIENNNEVDAVLVGTSMGGLAV